MIKFLLLLLSIIPTVDSAGFSLLELPNTCDACPKYLANLGTRVRGGLAAAENLSNEICDDEKTRSDSCNQIFHTFYGLINKVNDRTLPSIVSKEDRSLGCSTILKLCPEQSLEGKPLEANEVSCSSCISMFQSMLDVMTSLAELSVHLPKIFCAHGKPECLELFEKFLKYDSVALKLLDKETTPELVCKEVVGCKLTLSPASSTQPVTPKLLL